jgi:hypothetical protein
MFVVSHMHSCLTHAQQIMHSNVLHSEAEEHTFAPIRQVALEAIEWIAGWSPLLIVPSSSVQMTDERFHMVGTLPVARYLFSIE